MKSAYHFFVGAVASAICLSTAQATSPLGNDMLAPDQWALHQTLLFQPSANGTRVDDAVPTSDGSGSVVQVSQCRSSAMVLQKQRDQNGNVVLDANGNPVLEALAPQAQGYVCARDLGTAQKPLPATVADVDMNAPEAWSAFQSSGQEVVIGVIDTGVDYGQRDLQQHIWQNPGETTGVDLNNNGVDDGCEDNVDGADANTYVDDCHGIRTVPLFEESALDENGQHVGDWFNCDVYKDGTPAAEGDPMDTCFAHGTNMVGLMVADRNNRVSGGSNNYHGGISGVAANDPNIKVAMCNAATRPDDVYTTIPASWIRALLISFPFATADAVEECVDYFLSLKQDGVNIVVVSGSGGASKIHLTPIFLFPYGEVKPQYLLDTPAIQAAAARLAAQDILMVTAAGNNGWNNDVDLEHSYYPAALDNDYVIGVTGIAPDGALGGFSYGRKTIDVAAPGVDIVSLFPREEVFTHNDAYRKSDYVVANGSSQATAFTAGAIALVKANESTKNLNGLQIKRLLMSTGKPLASLTDKTVSGRTLRLADGGHGGMLNCVDATLVRRVTPLANATNVAAGTQMTIEALAYQCQNNYSGTVTVKIVNDLVNASGGCNAGVTGCISTTVQLQDNGVAPDAAANDGKFAASYTLPSNASNITATFINPVTNAVDDKLVINPEIFMDETGTTSSVGTWWPSTARSGYSGSLYRYAGNGGALRQFNWTMQVPVTGHYEVRMHVPTWSSFSTQLTYSVQHNDAGNGDAPTTSEVTATVSNPASNWQWLSLGEFYFTAGSHVITLSNQGANATVVADSIKLLYTH